MENEIREQIEEMKCDVCGEEINGINYRVCDSCDSIVCDNCDLGSHFCAICNKLMCPKCGDDYDREQIEEMKANRLSPKSIRGIIRELVVEELINNQIRKGGKWKLQ